MCVVCSELVPIVIAVAQDPMAVVNGIRASVAGIGIHRSLKSSGGKPHEGSSPSAGTKELPSAKDWAEVGNDFRQVIEY